MGRGDEIHIADNPSELRYELRVGTTLAGFLAYRVQDDVRVLVHTDVDPAFEGEGLGSRFVAGVLDDLSERGLKLVPLCPFVAGYLRRHPEHGALVVRDPAVPE